MSEIVDLKGFRSANNLSQQDVADFLGVSRSFVGQVESGFSKLPKDKIDKLGANNRGWDVSLLLVDGTHLGDGDRAAEIESRLLKSFKADEREMYKKYIELLSIRVEELKAQNEKYWEMICKLTEK